MSKENGDSPLKKKEYTQTKTMGSDLTHVGELKDVSKTTISTQLIPVLHQTTGPEQGRIVSLIQNNVLVIGRSKKCGLILDDPSCSRFHAEVKFHKDSFAVTIKDLGSTNGTLINGKKVTGEMPLEDGDRIKLGDNSVLRFSLVMEQEAQVQMDVYHKATRDALTNAFNKRRFEEALSRELSYQKRGQQSVGLVLFDIDFFKKINDQYGHIAGDFVLKELGQRVPQVIRSEDVFARVGGEEFAVLARNDSEESLKVLAERVRRIMEEKAVRYKEDNIAFTVSVGASYLAKDEENISVEDFIKQADDALYQSKNSGRNRVTLHKKSD